MAGQHAFGLRRGDAPFGNLMFPHPKSVLERNAPPLVVAASTPIVPLSAESESATRYLAERVFELAGFGPAVVENLEAAPGSGVILGTVDSDPSLRRLFDDEPIRPEGYALDITPHRALLAGADAAGLHWGVKTLLQLARSNGDGRVAIPSVSIVDWPEMRHRGLFVECSWGTDLMELEDWKNCIDVLSDLKLNSLGVGLYGCWGVQYRGEITQFLMTPIEGRPELHTDRTISYYSPSDACWREISYLPRMFEQDFFGEVVRYGKERHVSVWPYFNSLGHNRLLPRAYPATSSKNLDGSPKGSDFCTSNPATYDLLFDIYDQIIDRYLKPNGVDRFHIQLDEVSDWCQCPDCRGVPTHELYIRHMARLANHLVQQGINHIGVWNDVLLHDEAVTDYLSEQLGRNNLRDKLVWQWYMYGPQIWDSLKPELGLRNLVAPMTGFQHNYLSAYHISHFQNIYRMLRLGHNDGAEGAEPYAIYDYGYHRYYCCLSEFAWNRMDAEKSEEADLAAFQDRYARRFYGDSAGDMSAALDSMHKAYTMPLANDRTVLHGLSHYEYSCPPPPDHAKIPYPEAPFRRLRDDADHRSKLPGAAAELASARRALRDLDPYDLEIPLVAENLKAECGRFAALAGFFLQLLDMDSEYQTLKECAQTDSNRALRLYDGIRERLAEVVKLQMEAMTEWEAAKADYQHPHNLRVMSLVLKFAEEVTGRLETVRDAVARSSASELPDEIVLGTLADY